jgi:hypothetical protein
MPTAAPLKRLSRPETPPKAFRITPRVIHMLERVAQFRFLTSEQIARLDGGSHQKVLRLLQLCFFHGLLDRPANQHALLASFFDEGNRPLVYAISRKGAKVLAEAGIAVDADLQWVSKNRTATIPFLAHTIEVAETMMQFAFACDAACPVRVLDHHSLVPLMPPATQMLRDPFRLRVTHRAPNFKEVAINVVPDRLFALDDTQRRLRWHFALELDRGTMSNGTASTKLHGKSSYRRKIIGYFEAWKQGRHTAQWGCKSFRLLTVTTSEKRIQHMLDVQREVTNNTLPGFFLYTTRERMAEHGALGPAWISAERDDVRLLARA